MPLNDHSKSRITAFKHRGFYCRWAVDPSEELFSLFIINRVLGQGFIFYFKSHAELLAWASDDPIVRPKRIVRRFFVAEGVTESLAFVREDEMEVKADRENTLEMLDRLIAKKYKEFGELPPLVEEKPRELEFSRQVELDIP